MLSGGNFYFQLLQYLFNVVHLFTSEGVVRYFNLGPAIDCEVFDLCVLQSRLSAPCFRLDLKCGSQIMHGLECQELPYVNTEDCLFLKGEFSRFTLNIFDIFVHTCRMQLSYSSLKGAIILIMHCMCIFSSLRGMTSLELSCTVTKWSKVFFLNSFSIRSMMYKDK